jgi:bacillolysin
MMAALIECGINILITIHSEEHMKIREFPHTERIGRCFGRRMRVISLCTMAALLVASAVSVAQKNGIQGRGHLSKATVVMDRGERYPASIEFKRGDQPTLNAFVEEFRSTYALAPDNVLVPRSVTIDEIGMTQQRFQQKYKGVEVFGGEYTVQMRDGLVVSAIGKLAPELEMDATPLTQERPALLKALAHVGAEKYMWEDAQWEQELREKAHNPDTSYYPKGVLCWLPVQIGSPGASTYKLTFRFDIHSASPHAVRRVFVDARTGSIVKELPLESHCSAANFTSIFNGSRSISTDKYTANDFRLRDNCQAATFRVRDWNSTTTTANPLEIENTTNTWTTMNERFGATVLWEAMRSYDYFLSVHGRQSYDNANGSTEGYINAIFSCTGPPNPCYTSNNASMSFSGGTMKVGLGSSGTLANSYATVDIIGHEYSHAVTGTSSALVYQDESGALNESFSDIFGDVIENYVFGSNDWLMGDERTSGAIRSLMNPNAFGDPDTYLGTNWYVGSADNGGVHTNSGVQNFWFYLLTVGGSGTNDNGWAYNVPGIGLNAARAIAFRNMTVKLSANSTYTDARTGAIAAAADLYGNPSTQRSAVYKAWRAVGIDPCVLTCPSNIVLSNTPGQCGRIVNFAATTTSGDCDVVTTVPPSGSFFPVGTTVVTSTSTSGQTCTFTVTINDVEDPSITCPADITVSNDAGMCGAVVNFSVGSSDNCPGVSVASVPASGSFFPVGTTTVTSTATDAHGNSVQCSFDVTVNDDEDPQITCPVDFTADNDPGLCSAVVTYSVTASDNCPGVSVVSVPPSGSVFPVGVTTVTSTATDAHGNTSQCSFDIEVLDVEPPTITVSVSPTSLWPPNHTMRPINATVTVQDNCPNPTYVLTSITSNEPDNGTDDGDTPNDIQNSVFGTADLAFRVRSERSGIGTGRIYTATYTVTDGSGNVAVASATVTVPLSAKVAVVGAAPAQFQLEQNYPNPFNPTTVIRFGIPAQSQVSLRVYNMLGAEVATLVADDLREAGSYEVQFDASSLGAGTYTYRLTAVSTDAQQQFVDVKKMLLIK